jgi:mono/diheme cytochrome c family protein
MNYRLLGVVVVLLLLASGCNKTATSSTTNAKTSTTTNTTAPDQFAATRATFAKNCASCHGEKGQGGPVKLEDGTKLKVPTLCEGHALRHTDSDFVKQITKGGDGMPAFADKMKPDEINDCVRFIRHEFQGGMMSPAKDLKMN